MNEWISVKDEKPCIGDYVLASDMKHVAASIYTGPDRWIKCNACSIEDWCPTHWIRLAECPE